MHSYSVDSGSRLRIAIWIGAISIVLVESTSPYLGLLAPMMPYGWHPSAPTVGVISGAIIYLFDRHLWATWPVRKIGLVRVPNLSGTWSGTVFSSHQIEESDEKESENGVGVEVKIQQTWRKILVELETESSRSESVSASFTTSQIDPIIGYQFENRPDVFSEDSMNPHRGSTELRFIEGQGAGERDQLVGEYYTGGDRGNHGKMVLSRVKEEDK